MMRTKVIAALAGLGALALVSVSLISNGSLAQAQTATPTATVTATATATDTATATPTVTGTATVTPTATATGTATATATATGTATATTTPVPGSGGFASTPVFSTTGLAQVVFNGGTVTQLDAALRTAGASGAWAQTSGGVFQLYIVNGGFVNSQFTAAFPSGFSGVTALTIVRPGASPAATPSASAGLAR